MNQIPNIEEVVEKMLAIGWDSKLKKHDGTSIVVSFTKAELCDLLLNIEENHHQQLQKAREGCYCKDKGVIELIEQAREEERERISRSVNDKERQEQILANLLLRIAGVGIDFEIADSDLLTDYVVFETRPVDRYSTIYRVERNCMLDHSELDQLTRDDWNEDMERSHTLAELDQDKKDCEHYQAMQEGAAVGLDQEGKCIDCGAEVLRTDTNK